MTNQMIMLMLPWFGNHAGELYYSNMTVSAPGTVDKRKALRLVRKFYKREIGITVDKMTLEKIWRRRHVTRAMTYDTLNAKLTAMARRSYEEVKSESDSDIQEGAAA